MEGAWHPETHCLVQQQCFLIWVHPSGLKDLWNPDQGQFFLLVFCSFASCIIEREAREALKTRLCATIVLPSSFPQGPGIFPAWRQAAGLRPQLLQLLSFQDKPQLLRNSLGAKTGLSFTVCPSRSLADFFCSQALSGHYPRQPSFPTLHVNVFWGKTTSENQTVLVGLGPRRRSDVGTGLWTHVRICCWSMWEQFC